MKIFRAASTSNKWTALTDSADTKHLAESWWPGLIIGLDGTIDKGGNRHTSIGVQLEPDDIANAISGLLRYYKKESGRLAEALESADVRRNELEEAVGRILDFVAENRESAPSPEVLLDAVEELTSHFLHSGGKEPPTFEWDATRESSSAP